MLQDKIEELQASLDAVGAEAKALSEQNTATEQELQVGRLLLALLPAASSVMYAGSAC